MRINYDIFWCDDYFHVKFKIFWTTKNVWHFIKQYVLKTQKNVTLRAGLLCWVWEENRLINDELRLFKKKKSQFRWNMLRKNRVEKYMHSS